MSWQDIVFTAGSWVLIIALLPTVFSKNKPTSATSFMYGTILLIFTFTYLSLALWFTTLSTGITALIWYIIGVQGFLKKK
jgi:hypothetical protein